MTIVTSGRTPTISEAMDELSKREGSPCLECLVASSCRKSFVDKSACEKFAYFMQELMIEAGMLKDENQD